MSRHSEYPNTDSSLDYRANSNLMNQKAKCLKIILAYLDKYDERKQSLDRISQAYPHNSSAIKTLTENNASRDLLGELIGDLQRVDANYKTILSLNSSDPITHEMIVGVGRRLREELAIHTVTMATIQRTEELIAEQNERDGFRALAQALCEFWKTFAQERDLLKSLTQFTDAINGNPFASTFCELYLSDFDGGDLERVLAALRHLSEEVRKYENNYLNMKPNPTDNEH